MANPSANSSRTSLWIAVALAVLVAGYLILSSGDSATPPVPREIAAEEVEPDAVPAPSGPIADRRDASLDVEIVEDGREQPEAKAPSATAAVAADRTPTPEELRDQAIDEVRGAIRTEPDRKATEAFLARVAAPPPTTPDWVVDAIEAGPPPVPVEIQAQIARGKPEVPADMQEAIERTLRDGPPPTPPELQRAIDAARR